MASTTELACLWIARHGETEWNALGRVQGQADVPLNERGRAQAARLARRLSTVPIDTIHASDLVRATSTAEAVASVIGLSPVVSPAWREIGLGVIEGTDQATCERQYGELVSAAARASGPLVDGAEPYPEFEARLRAGFDRLRADHAGEQVLVVTHGGAAKTLIAHLIRLAPEHLDRLSMRANCGLSMIDFRRGRPQLVHWNDTQHLDGQRSRD